MLGLSFGGAGPQGGTGPVVYAQFAFVGKGAVIDPRLRRAMHTVQTSKLDVALAGRYAV